MPDADPNSMRAPEIAELNPYAAELRSEAQVLMNTPVPRELVDQAGRISIPVTRH